jgi:phosphoribosylformimino-5-aminoimidazole carboxamide ribotide isomerase
VEIIPAIDLRQGQVVRLNQGDFDRQTTFSNDPLSVAREFQDAGASRLHVVDLDGALEGAPVQNELYTEIATQVDVPIEVGGGFRTDGHVALALEAGIGRVVLGTVAIEAPDMVVRLVERHGPERIVVGLDASEGRVAVSGWREKTNVEAGQLMTEMHGAGVRRFVYTDIARDGTLTSPNFQAIDAMVVHGSRLGGVRLIASGGIGEIEHLRRLAASGVEGAVVGSAIYRGTIDLRTAVDEFGRT